MARTNKKLNPSKEFSLVANAWQMKNNKRAQIYDNVDGNFIIHGSFSPFSMRNIFSRGSIFCLFAFVSVFFSVRCAPFFLPLLPLLRPVCCRFWCARLIHVDFTLRILFFFVRRKQHGKVTMNKTDTTNVFMDFFFSLRFLLLSFDYSLFIIMYVLHTVQRTEAAATTQK